MTIAVGPAESVKPSGAVPRPPPRFFEGTIVLDVINIIGAQDAQARAFFRSKSMRFDREVGFRIGEVKAANMRPGFYKFRLEFQIDPLSAPKGVTIVMAGQPIPGARPPTFSLNDIRLIEGEFTLRRDTIVIQVDERAVIETKPTLPEGGASFSKEWYE
jgi:hypothetical protein